jgi:large subunit ribosomal protein L21
MYAIVETGGKQYRVKPGDTVAVERLDSEPGETLDLDRVLLVAGNGDDRTRVGSPGVAGAVVRAEVLEHIRGEKIIVFRYKSKVRYRRKTGHRQSLTRLRITDILLDGASAVATEKPAEARTSAETTGRGEAQPTAPRRRAAPEQRSAAGESKPATGDVEGPERAERTQEAEGARGTEDTDDTTETKS